MKTLTPLFIRRYLGSRYECWYEKRQKEKLLKLLKGNLVECNICRWTGRAFTDDQWHPGTICPNCGSQVRHRLLTATLDGLSTHSNLAESQLLRGKDILHFAPERQLRERLQQSSPCYVTADFDRGDCDLKLDMSSMPSVTNQSFDIVIACDVLEHVPDDLAAMRELYRILRLEGVAVLSVPQMDSPSTTDHDPSVTTEIERERRYGQKDHVRMYGDDFLERLITTGFDVTTLTEADFSPELCLRLVLTPPVKSLRPLATNLRRIYFCKKSAPM